MTRSERRLVRHLILAIVLKLAVLAVLGWVFVPDTAARPDGAQVARHLAGTSAGSSNGDRP